MDIYLIIAAIFGVGFVLGGLSTWIQIRQYKRACGMNPDPLDGKELTSMERFVERGRKSIEP